MNNILDSVISIPCHPKNRGGKRKASAIKYLVYHYTGNDGDTDANNAKYYRDNVVKASAHYFVDDDSVTQSVEDLGIAWAVGGAKWSDCPKTGGGTMYGIVTNANSISIELCDTKRDGQLMATEATLARAAELGRALMEKYNIPIERVVRHFDVTGKHCPAYFMDEAKWGKFKERLLPKEEETMDIIDGVLRIPTEDPTPDSTPTAWEKEGVEWAVKNKLLRGDGKGDLKLHSPITMAQFCVMLKRYHDTHF